MFDFDLDPTFEYLDCTLTYSTRHKRCLSFLNNVFFIFSMDFSSEKKRGVGHVYGLVLNSNPTTLQHSLDPPQQRQHQVLQVLAVALLQGGD